MSVIRKCKLCLMGLPCCHRNERSRVSSRNWSAESRACDLHRGSQRAPRPSVQSRKCWRGMAFLRVTPPLPESREPSALRQPSLLTKARTRSSTWCAFLPKHLITCPKVGGTVEALKSRRPGSVTLRRLWFRVLVYKMQITTPPTQPFWEGQVRWCTVLYLIASGT